MTSLTLHLLLHPTTMRWDEKIPVSFLSLKVLHTAFFFFFFFFFYFILYPSLITGFIVKENPSSTKEIATGAAAVNKSLSTTDERRGWVNLLLEPIVASSLLLKVNPFTSLFFCLFSSSSLHSFFLALRSHSTLYRWVRRNKRKLRLRFFQFVSFILTCFLQTFFFICFSYESSTNGVTSIRTCINHRLSTFDVTVAESKQSKESFCVSEREREKVFFFFFSLSWCLFSTGRVNLDKLSPKYLLFVHKSYKLVSTLN